MQVVIIAQLILHSSLFIKLKLSISFVGCFKFAGEGYRDGSPLLFLTATGI